jgi:hypothetical protein
MRLFLTHLRDGTTSHRLGSVPPDWLAAPDTPLADDLTNVEGRVLVERLIACLDRDESLRKFRPLVVLTGRDLSKDGCESLFGYADRGRQIGIVSSFRLGHVDPLRAHLRLENVIRHECGHLRGLRHCGKQGCLMHPAGDPEDLDRRSAEPCSRCSRRRSLSITILNRAAAAFFLLLAFAGVNLADTLLRPAPIAPFAAAAGSSELLCFNGTPVQFSSSLVDPAGAPGELNRLFMMLTPPSLGVRTHDTHEAVVVSGEKEILRVRHDQAAVEAGKLAAQLNELIEAKGTRTSLCAECHLARKPEVLEAAYGRKWGIGPF